MKTNLFIFVLLSWASASVATEKPNFVIVLGDDHGVYHSSPYGSPEFNTPNMQALADLGMRFDEAYVASPACGPSRAALFTGLMPYNNGIVGNHEAELKRGVLSLIPLLLEQGYDVAFRGKVGHANPNMHSCYIPEAVHVIGTANKPMALDLPMIEDYLKHRQHPERPLALFIGSKQTHTPWPQLAATHIKPETAVIPERIFDTPEARVQYTRYMQAAENTDRQLGSARRLVDTYLNASNTMILYTADHGIAWPFAKWSLYEAGIRTPLLVLWPGKIKPNSVSTAMVSWIDLMPTLIDIAGGTVPNSIDGKSFAGVLFGKTDQHRNAIFAVHKGDKGTNVYPIRSVRVGDWKYIRNLHPEFCYTTHTDRFGYEGNGHGGQHWPSYLEAAKTNAAALAFLTDYHTNPAEELYNITRDPHEKNNLADSPEMAEKLSELRELVDRRMAEVDDDQSLSGTPFLLKDYDYTKPSQPVLAARKKKNPNKKKP